MTVTPFSILPFPRSIGCGGTYQPYRLMSSLVLNRALYHWSMPTLDGSTVVDARVALGAVADRPIRGAEVEAAVRGLPLAQAADAARTALRGAIRPIDDVRSTSTYRRDVAENIVARFFTAVGAMS